MPHSVKDQNHAIPHFTEKRKADEESLPDTSMLEALNNTCGESLNPKP